MAMVLYYQPFTRLNRYVICLNTLKILVMGGTRFVGKAVVSKLIEKRCDLTVFTRGNNKLPEFDSLY